MTWLQALCRPLPLAVGMAGYTIAALVAIWPLLASYAGGWLLLVGLTAGCQVMLMVAEVYGAREGVEGDGADPLLVEMAAVRSRIAQKIEAVPGDALKSGLPALLRRLDDEVLPELRRLVGQNRRLAEELQGYQDERRKRLRPSEKTLRELENLFGRQQAVIQGVVQQIVDLDASLSGLIQERDEGGMMASVREWNAQISERWRALRDMAGER